MNCLSKPGRTATEDDFDISLNYAILRNSRILDVQTEAPTGGWGKDNIDPGHIRLGDDIERVHILRNALCHSPLASVSQKQFDVIVKDMKDVMHRSSNLTGFQLVKDIDTIVRKALTFSDVNMSIDAFVVGLKRADAQGTGDGNSKNIRIMVILFHFCAA